MTQSPPPAPAPGNPPPTAGPAADSAGLPPPDASARPKVNVLAMFLWLTAITGCEVGLVYLHLQQKLLATLLICTSLTKMLLVAIYFMHLKFEGKLIRAMLIAVVILGLIFFFALFPDLVFSHLK
ncbi:MAG: cytochrome C oxidase subunit IV family protein [Planctomycetota bacterium]